MKLAAALATALTVALVACSDSHSHTDAGASSFPSCQAIVAACHEVDPGSGPVHECHESAEAAKADSECSPKKDACLALCKAPAVDAGVDASGDASARDAARD